MKRYTDASRPDRIGERIEAVRNQYLHNPELKKRYAFEWYVKTQDLMYFREAMRAIHDANAANEREHRRITTLAVTSTVMALAAITIAAISLL